MNKHWLYKLQTRAAAEELDLEWPEFLSVERIKSRITEIALWLLLLAGTVATGVIYFWATNS